MKRKNEIDFSDDSAIIDLSPTEVNSEQKDTLETMYLDGKRRSSRLNEAHITYHIVQESTAGIWSRSRECCYIKGVF